MARRPKNKSKTSSLRDLKGPACPIWKEPITSVAKFCEVCNSMLAMEKRYWFRGQADINWMLTPSALRYKDLEKREKALNLIREFKRYSATKLGTQAPHSDETLKWIQLAQHYGLPTRWLDWTEINTVAVYFSCCDQPNQDGAVFVLNPIDINREYDPKCARILDPNDDKGIVNSYLDLGGSRNPKGCKTIANSPVWHSERIQKQQGMFTIQGSQSFSLTNLNESQDRLSPSLRCLRTHELNTQSTCRYLDRT